MIVRCGQGLALCRISQSDETVLKAFACLQVPPSVICRPLKRTQIVAFHVGSNWRFNIETIDS
jgi:hypothetical protein